MTFATAFQSGAFQADAFQIAGGAPPGVSIDAGGMLIGRPRGGGGGATVGPDMAKLRPIIAEIEALLREPPQPKKGRVKRRVELAPEQAADLADRIEAVAQTGPASQLADRLLLIRARQALAAADLDLVVRALEQLRLLAAMADDEDAFLMVMT